MKLIVANWKMQLTIKESEKLSLVLVKNFFVSKNQEVIICPSFPALSSVKKNIGNSGIKLGAQNAFWEEKGAFTGEVSPCELKELGVAYCLVGHSERRLHLQESDEMVNKKVKALLTAGLTPIICVGENAKEHTANKTKAVLKKQIRFALQGLHTRSKESLVFAYEPVWAIGTHYPDSVSDVVKIQTFIRQEVRQVVPGIKERQIKVLYGGSVDEKNSAIYLLEPEVNGLLVGGASLQAETFGRILRAIEK